MNQYAIQQMEQGHNKGAEDLAEALYKFARDLAPNPVQSRYGFKNNPTTVGGVTPYLHGGGGLLSPLGQSRGVLSAMLEVGEGAVTYFPVVEEVQDFNTQGMDSPYLTFITGVTQGALETWSNQPSEPCDDAPVGGLLKACTVTFPYGRFFQKLRQVNALDVRRRINRGEFEDLRLMNTSPSAGDPFRAQGTQPNANIIAGEINSRLYEMGVSFNRLTQPLAYTGSPAQNLGTEGARQFIGLDRLINTNFWVDAFTANICTALDSIIYNFQETDVIDVDPNGNRLYDIFQGMYRWAKSNASRMGLDPAKWVFGMTDDLFYEIARVASVLEYNRAIETVTALNTANIDGAQLHLAGTDVQRSFEAMYRGRYIPIDGEMVPVYLDYGIEATPNGGGSFLSDIYLINETATGRQMTYWDFNRFTGADYNRIYPELFGNMIYSTDGGRFIWARSFKNYCAELTAVCEPRIMQHTPMLCGRITNISYTPTFATRSPFPASDGTFYNGGRQNSKLPLIYNNGDGTTPTYPGINLQ